jgi:hypothetical protein
MNQDFVLIHKDKPFENFGYFTGAELYSNSADAPAYHGVSKIAIHGFNVIRGYYNVPVKINSTYRTVLHQLSLSSVGNSQHVQKDQDGTPVSLAIDGTFLTDEHRRLFMPDLHKQILERGPLFERLREAGVTGFGIYDTFIHLDSRPSVNLIHEDDYGKYAFWDNRTKKPELPKTFFFDDRCFLF